MLEKLRNFVSVPVFEGDEERTHTAHLLYVVAWTLIVSLTLMEISFIIAMPKNTTRWLLLVATADIANLAILALTQRSYTRLASVALIFELWALTTVYAWTAGGIHAPAVMFYFIFVITAGLLLGSRAGAVAAVVSSFTTGGMVYAEMMGMMPLISVDHTTLTRWIAIVFLITILISIQSLTTNTTTKALQRAQQELTERRQAQEALRANAEQYRMLFEESPTGIEILDTDTTGYRILAINPTGCEILGYPQEELIGMNINRLIDPVDLVERPVPSLEEMQSGTTLRRERIIRRKDGTRVSLLGNFKQMPNRRLLYIFQDITERKKAENDLRESEQRYRAVVENQTEFIVRWRPDGTRTFVNDAYCRYFDLTPEQGLSTSFIPLIIGEDRQAMEERILRLMFDGVHAETYIHQVIRPDNSVGWQEWTDQAIRHETGQVVEFQSVGRDVTERKLAEEKLRKQAEQMSALYDIGLAITSNLDLDQILHTLFEKCRQLLAFDTFYIAMYDKESWIIRHPLFYDGQANAFVQVEERDIETAPGLSGYIVRSGQTLYLRNSDDPSVRKKYGDIAVGTPSKSYVGVPMLFHGAVVGVLSIQKFEEAAYTSEQIRLLETIATQVAIAIENARLYQAERVGRQEAETLRESLASIVTTFELKEVVERILDQIKFVIPYDTASIWRVDREWLKPIVGRDIPPEISLADMNLRVDGNHSSQSLIQGEKPFILKNNVQEELTDFKGPHSYINSWLAVPLKKRDKIIGQISLDGRGKNQFTVHHAELAVTFADQVAIALENASLYTEIQQELAERKRAEDEIQQLNTELEHRVIERTAQLNEANQNIHQEKVRLEQYSRQRELMGTMTDLLQASLTTEEACGIVSRYMQLLFPNRDGALYLLNASETLEPIAMWGEQKSLDTVFGMNDCWALRRGKSYRFGGGSPNPPCAHVGREITQSALCIPLAAQGESMGSLHISTENIGEGGQMDEEEQRFIETITDSVALALANVRLRERLRIQSIRDGLTGLFNRRYLDETLPREIHRAERSQRPISVLMFDIDSFKKFNDVYGHDGGDLVLKRMAELITSKVRPSDIACRSGGEEFVIILPDTPLEIAHARAESLREAASQMKVQHNGKDLGTITISLGVAAYPQHGTTRDTLIKSADGAAYQAKEAGKNRVVAAE